MPGQTVQTQIRLLLDQIPSASFGLHYSMVEPHSSNFRVITTIFLGVRIFRKFTVLLCAGVTVYLDPLGSLTPGGQDTLGYLDPSPGYLDPQAAKYPLSGILPADTLIGVY